VRPSNFAPATNGRYERALLLPEIPAPATPSTLILPAGWFNSGRFVEIFSDRKQVAKLLNMLEKGNDFDRGTIIVV
jgi:cyclic-di-GMP-binding protein